MSKNYYQLHVKENNKWRIHGILYVFKAALNLYDMLIKEYPEGVRLISVKEVELFESNCP